MSIPEGFEFLNPEIDQKTVVCCVIMLLIASNNRRMILKRHLMKRSGKLNSKAVYLIHFYTSYVEQAMFCWLLFMLTISFYRRLRPYWKCVPKGIILTHQIKRRRGLQRRFRIFSDMFRGRYLPESKCQDLNVLQRTSNYETF
jgi:hypothetical protein